MTKKITQVSQMSFDNVLNFPSNIFFVILRADLSSEIAQ